MAIRSLLPVSILSLALACPGSAEVLRVMSFDVHRPSTGGPNSWESRRDLLVEAIGEMRADIFGTQELYKQQADYITAKLPEYAWIGLSRYGNSEDEHCAIFYVRDKYRVLDSGNFWLSDTPNRPGSRSWDVAAPRVVTWARFEVASGGKTFYVYNTEFPDRPEDDVARLNCAKLLRSRLDELPAGTPLILTGDFNTRASGMAYNILTASLKDPWITAVTKTGPEGTFHGFEGLESQSRIDWVLYRGFVRARQAENVTKNIEGKYPSDHYPVFVELEFY